MATTEKDLVIKQLKDTVKDLTSKLKSQKEEEKSANFTHYATSLVQKDGIIYLYIFDVDAETGNTKVNEIKKIGKNIVEANYYLQKANYDYISKKLK